MNAHLNFGKHFVIPAAIVLAAHVSATAQKPVESTHIDEKYAYTTVVYKNKAANDQDVLTSLESEFSIGDVVRVTLAPPPVPPSSPIAASEPVYADKSRGEDTWLPSTANTSENLVASTEMLPIATFSVLVEANPISININEQIAAPTPAVEQTQRSKALKSERSAKSPRKTKEPRKFKPRKKGKQGYACPKF
jgi:hypothetical protein